MSHRADAKVPQIISRQRSQNLSTDVIIAECGSVLLKSQSAEPVRNFGRHCCRPTISVESLVEDPQPERQGLTISQVGCLNAFELASSYQADSCQFASGIAREARTTG